MFVSLSVFPGGEFSVQSDLGFLLFPGAHVDSHVFYKSKSRAKQCTLWLEQKGRGIAAHKQAAFDLPVALPAEQDKGVGRGDSTWFPPCIDTPVTSAAEIAIHW